MNLANRTGCLVAIALFASSPAFAYLDPGTGATLLQILAAVGVALGMYYKKVISFVKKIFRRS